MGILFGCLLVDRPEKFVDHKSAHSEKEGILEDDLNVNNKSENGSANIYPEDRDNSNENVSDSKSLTQQEDNISQSMKEYSELDFYDGEKGGPNTTLAVEQTMETLFNEIGPTTHTPSSIAEDRLIRYIRNEGIEGVILLFFCCPL